MGAEGTINPLAIADPIGSLIAEMEQWPAICTATSWDSDPVAVRAIRGQVAPAPAPAQEKDRLSGDSAGS
jgi:hypothetical protein